MIINGIDTDSLPDQFPGAVAGDVLILDGDGPAYRCAATVKRIDTALGHFQQEVLTQMFLTRCSEARVHLTAHNSRKAGRFNIKAVKPYQGQRKGKAKPSLLEPLREAVALRENWLDEYSVTMHLDLEADDGMMQDAYLLKDRGVIWSDDKDLRMTPYRYWDMKDGVIRPAVADGFGELWLSYTPSGTPKCLGHGRVFFWAQMLMGDQADNIQGVLSVGGKKCGAVLAYETLQDMRNESDAANTVLDAYREIDQNPLPEAWLLWLLRWKGDNAWNYMNELALSEANGVFLHACAGRSWFEQAN